MKIERKAANQRRMAITIASSESAAFALDENRACVRARLGVVRDRNESAKRHHYDVLLSFEEVAEISKVALMGRSGQLKRSRELEALVLTKNAGLRRIAADTKMAYSASLNTAAA